MGEVTALKSAVRTPAAPQCYVRVTRADHHGFIEFQFAMSDPDLFLDMTLPPAAFAEFCAQHRVRHLTADESAAVDRADLRWRFGADHEDHD